MNLSKKQKAILISLYKRFVDSGRRDTFVATKGVTTMTMKSLLKTGYIETDRAIHGVPSNARITDAGIEVMKEYFEKRRLTIDALITRNKQFMRFVQNTEEKRLALLQFLQPSPMIPIEGLEITHRGFGIFEVTSSTNDEQYYGVYNLTEGNDVEIGGCSVVDLGRQRYYIEKVKMI